MIISASSVLLVGSKAKSVWFVFMPLGCRGCKLDMTISEISYDSLSKCVVSFEWIALADELGDKFGATR